MNNSMSIVKLCPNCKIEMDTNKATIEMVYIDYTVDVRVWKCGKCLYAEVEI